MVQPAGVGAEGYKDAKYRRGILVQLGVIMSRDEFN
jgi:hypothetical protein